MRWNSFRLNQSFERFNDDAFEPLLVLLQKISFFGGSNYSFDRCDHPAEKTPEKKRNKKTQRVRVKKIRR